MEVFNLILDLVILAEATDFANKHFESGAAPHYPTVCEVNYTI